MAGGFATGIVKADGATSSVQITRVTSACSLAGLPVDISTAFAVAGAVPLSIAGGASGFGAVWADVKASADIRRRVFGPHYCD